MLHTLIPTIERARLLREYRVRAAIVLCFMLSISVVMGIATLVPSFLRASAQEREQLGIAAMLKKAQDTSGANKIANELAVDNTIVGIFADQSTSIRFSQIVERLVAARGAVTISSITLKTSSPKAVSISLNGTAATRDQLLAYKATLESLVMGTKVDLPISYLAKSTNVGFTMNVTEPLP
jgi:hypothetical protein